MSTSPFCCMEWFELQNRVEDCREQWKKLAEHQPDKKANPKAWEMWNKTVELTVRRPAYTAFDDTNRYLQKHQQRAALHYL